jgi:uncharacterized protein
MAYRSLVFAKEPLPGAVKTRLCPPLSLEQAARFHAAVLDDLLERLCQAPGLDPRLLLWPPAAVERGRRRWSVDVQAQRGADLAERLDAALCEHAPAVLVGSDLPLLAAEHVLEAQARLARGAELVLAPDGGGGFGLVGLARPCPGLFASVPMSAPSTLEATLARARSLALRVELLPVLPDVDTHADLCALLEPLARATDLHAPRTRALVHELVVLHPCTGTAARDR